jgi:hypothetical protein
MRVEFHITKFGRRAGFWLLLIAIGALGGCFRASKPDQFYMLRALGDARGAAPASEGPLVGLGPIRIPAYLDRPQIVTAVSGQEYRLSDDHRWAERLDVNIARVTAQNLSTFIPSDRILLHPWPREPKPDVQVAINIQEMHVDPEGEVRMSALWTLHLGKDSMTNHKFTCHQSASTSDYARMVEVESQCLARLNRDIAAAIKDIRFPG